MAGKTQIPAWCDLNRNLTLFQDISRIKVAIKGHKSYKLQVCVDHLIWKDPSGSVHLCVYISYIYIYVFIYIYIWYQWIILLDILTHPQKGWWLLCKLCRSLVQPRFFLQKSQLLPAESVVFFCKPRWVAPVFSRCSSFPIYNSEPHFPLALTKLLLTSITVTSHQFFTKLNQWVPQVWPNFVGRIETIEGSTRGVTLGRPGVQGSLGNQIGTRLVG